MGIICYMFFLFRKSKNMNYNTDKKLYDELDELMSELNQKNRLLYWKRGYQALWIEVRRTNGTEKIDIQPKKKSISFNVAKPKNKVKPRIIEGQRLD